MKSGFHHNRTLAMGNLATAMNNTQALQAAAIILGSEPTSQAIAYRAEQLQLLPLNADLLLRLGWRRMVCTRGYSNPCRYKETG
jgi:hypothetical protein